MILVLVTCSLDGTGSDLNARGGAPCFGHSQLYVAAVGHLTFLPSIPKGCADGMDLDCFGSRGIPGSRALDSGADGSRGLSEERVCADRLYDLT